MPKPAHQHVVAGIAFQRVVKVRAGQVLDIDRAYRLRASPPIPVPSH